MSTTTPLHSAEPVPATPGGINPPRRPLGRQFLQEMLLPLLLAFLLAAVSGILIAYSMVKNELETRRTITLDIYAEALIIPLRDCDATDSTRIVNRLAGEPRVSGIELDALCSDLITAVGRTPDAQRGRENFFSRDISYLDAQGQERHLGSLLVEFHPVPLWRTVLSIQLRYLTICAAMIMVMMIGALLAFRRIVSVPVNQFRNTVQRQIGSEVTVPINQYHRNDEFGDLAQAYADLMIELATVIDKLRNKEKTLQQVARIDPLTGLANRMVLEEELSFAVAVTLLEGGEGHLLLIDLDGFKTINDSYGHNAGDKVLQEVAQRMSSAVRSSDTVARLGGDEFAIVMEGRGLSKAIPELMQTLSTLISAPIQFEGHTLQVGASIGIARFPTDGSTMKKLMAKADQAMYAKKRKKR